MDRLTSVLVLRARVLHPPHGGTVRERFARELETELATTGWLLTPRLRDAVARIPQAQATAWGDWLLGTLVADVGGDRPWLPLYRRFPHSTPANTDRLYVERVIAGLLQAQDAPCVLCGTDGQVRPVSPCGHLVCATCFSPHEYSACPICNRRLDPTDPYLVVPEPPPAPRFGPPVRLRRLDLGRGPLVEAADLRDALAGRRSPLSAAEREDLELLVEATTAPGDLAWLPELPARQTRAVLTAQALRRAPAAVDQAAAQWGTATDIARTLWTLSGGDPDLDVPRPVPEQARRFEWWRLPGEARQEVPGVRVAPLARPLRRAVLARLDALPMPTVIEDVLRHPTVWKRIAERLHPFEQAARHPRATLVFSVLRRSRHLRTSAAGQAVLDGAERGWVSLVVDGDRVGARVRTLAAQVEPLLTDGDASAALQVLTPRPGDLLRRLDHLAREWAGDPAGLAAAAGRAAQVASPKLVLAAQASLSGRDRVVTLPARELARHRARTVGAGLDGDQGAQPPTATAGERAPRVFFPQGGAAFTWREPDRRPLLPTELVQALTGALGQALLDRAARLPRFDLAVVDTALADVPVPAGTQSASASSLPLPRGTRLAHPPVDNLRLFLHWQDPPGVRVDLDLSVMLFDATWRRLDHCDYTRLRSRLGAVHSGDLTSAPPPLGATEFLDLDLPALRGNGVAWAVPVVFSYNDVPFQNLNEALAGVGRPLPGQHFDPAGVFVRFTLVGNSRVSVPFLLDVVDGRLRWVDQHLPAAGYAHSVGTQGDRLGQLAADLESLYAGPTRARSLDLALLHARARADRLLLRDPDGTLRGPDGTPVTPPAAPGRVLVVCLEEPPTLPGAGAGSVVVSALGSTGGARPLDDLLDDLEAV